MLMMIASIIVPYLYSELRGRRADERRRRRRPPIARPASAPRAVIYAAADPVRASIYLLPLFVMLVNSLKPLDEIRGGNMLALPEQFTLAPWRSAWSTAQIGVEPTGLKPYFLNSIMMVVPAVLISTLLGALNGYVLTKWRFPRRTISCSA